jgi:hypothetical protein
MFCTHLTRFHTHLTGVHEGLTRFEQTAALLFAMTLACGCPPTGPAGSSAPDLPSIELPPPLVGGTGSLQASPADPVDIGAWRMPSPEESPGDAPWLRLIYGQDARAEMEACGCPGAPSGGYARRRTLNQHLTRWLPDVLVVEGPTTLSKVVGGTETVQSRDRARAREIVSYLPDSGTTAFFPGQADFAALGPAALAEAAQAASLPIVVTNLAESVRPSTFRRSLLWERGGKRVLLLGLLGRPRSEDERLHSPSTDVVETVRSVLAQEGPVDVVVAFTSAIERERRGWLAEGLDADVHVLLAPFERPGDQAERWLGDMYEVRADPLGRALRRVDIVVSGRASGVARIPLGSVQEVRNVALREGEWLRQARRLERLRERIAAGEDPRERSRGFDDVVRVDPATDPDEVQLSLARLVQERAKSLSGAVLQSTPRHLAVADLVVLGEDLVEDPAIAGRIKAYHAKWIETIAEDVAAAPPPPPDGLYAGMDACVSCHPAIHGRWTDSAHASAYRDIYERGEHRNPDCLGCHSTGFGVPGGFADPSDPSLLNVQCEACHGPMDKHVRDAQRPGLRPAGGRQVDEAVCRTCHDAANSPEFNYAEYLPRISHPGVGDPSSGGGER